ncbi:MAG: methyltransferase domain-containing protein [Cyanobacteria bacterium P01_D01_bin.1]
MTEAKVRQQYNRLADVYDQRWNAYITKTLDFFETWVNLSHAEKVLDVACGTGEFERIVLAKKPEQQIAGVDISEQMLAIAQRKLQPFPNVSFTVANASNLPFADQSFDVVVSANAFHYFDHPDIALREMRRVLKPSGRVIILDWCRDFLSCRVCDIFLKLIDPAHRQCYTQEEFHYLLATAGFEIESTEKARFSWIWGLMIATGRPSTII